jgi:hypothetical protein
LRTACTRFFNWLLGLLCDEPILVTKELPFEVVAEEDLLMSSKSKDNFPWTTMTWLVIAGVSALLWVLGSQRSMERGVLLVGLSLASFMIGCLVGFVFTSYGEEIGTVGKVRDALIGAIAGLTIAKAAEIKGAINTFAVGQDAHEFPLMLSAAIVYVALGFLFMFFQRELILNVALAEKRFERGRLEGSREAGLVILRFLAALPASVLSGVDDIDNITGVGDEEAKALREELYSADVETFLQEAKDSARRGSLDWDVCSKTAYISYYRTYFERDNKRAEVDQALEWIVRALNMNPLHVDLTMKYSDMLAASGEHEAAVAVLERLASRPEAPMLVKQWLGYFLLDVEGREDDAIEYSNGYLALFPADTDAKFNIACSYAQKYCTSRRAKHTDDDQRSKDRKSALDNLREALYGEPDYAATVRAKWTLKGESFDCFASDPDFLQLLDEASSAPPHPSEAG